MYCGKVINFFNKQPIPNVTVSDGMNIVFTDSEGKFSLPGWEKARVINVGLLTECHCDWYINIEGHSGDFDFEVKPVKCGDNFSFLHISDTEIEGRSKNDWIDFARNLVKEERPLFFANTGDLCRKDGLERHHLLMNSESFGCPVRYAIGNHDFTDGEKKYEKNFGPTYYSFDCGKIHFVVLSMGGGDTPSLYTIDEREAWLKRDLELKEDGKSVIMLSHFFEPHDWRGGCHTTNEIYSLAGDKGLRACIFGHDHYNYVHEYKGFLRICSARPDSGGIDSTPAGARKINVCGDKVTTEYIYNIPSPPAPPAKCEWHTKLDGQIEFSRLSAAEGTLWVCTNDDGYPKKCGIYKLDSESGEVLAFIPTEEGIKGGGAYYDGKFYAEDTSGTVYCADDFTAELLWTAKIDISDKFYTRNGVIAADGKIIAGSGKKVTALDPNTGKILWENYDAAGCEGPSRCVYDEKRRQIIKARQWKCISAISIDSGETVWENSERFCWFNTSTPTLDGDVIYKRGHTGIGILDASNGSTLKCEQSFTSFDVSGECAVDEERIYVPTATAGVLAFDKSTLELKLSFPSGNARLFTAPYFPPDVRTVETTPKILKDRLIFAGSDGYVYVYDKNTAVQIKKINVGSPVIADPIIGDGYVITADFGGNVKKFAL